MPAWDYRCPACARTVTLVFINWRERDIAEGVDYETTVCSCGSRMARETPTGTNFKLVGAGFHDNDYPKK